MNKNFHSIVVLTGAGISAESGIQTFRAADGLWHEHRIEDVASPEGFQRNPALVHDFYNERRRQLLSPEIKENPAHRALARLEKHFEGEFLLVTQNIDDLHERAGSKNLLHMHGELLVSRCVNSAKQQQCRGDLKVTDRCNCCTKPSPLRPHIVWFGEMPLEMETIEYALSQCDLFISIGTSGHVYPAAGFVQLANAAGATTLELNLEPSLLESQFTQARYGPATQLLPEFVEQLIGPDNDHDL